MTDSYNAFEINPAPFPGRESTETTMSDMPDTTDADGLTVGQSSKTLGVTIRALHHWDEICLV